jgi:YVTN family beta-propeller protein
MPSTRPRRTSRLLAALAATALLAGGAAYPAQAAEPAAAAPLRDVVMIGNALAGTVSFLDGRTFANLGSFNVIPDKQLRIDAMNFIEKAGYEIVRGQVGDKFTDDVALSPDGRTLYVSRNILADAAAFDLASGRQLWRFKVNGFKADHIALSPDGTRLVISATTASEVQVIDTANGTQVGRFATGTYPHGNDYSADGTKIYNSSIGTTSLPKGLNFLKGARQLTVVNAQTLAPIRNYQFEFGIRPAVFMPDGKTMYAQLSYLNGLVEYDLDQGKILRTVTLPYSAAGQALNPDQYPQNSAHHGLAVSGDGNKLCAAGTIDDYVAILSRPALTTDRIITGGSLPYWAQTSLDGRHCLVTNSKDNTVSVISYDTAQEVRRIPVGTFPQRERLGQATPEAIAALTPTNG